MHEWALAEAILKSAEEVAEKEKLKEITEVPSGSANYSRLNDQSCASQFLR